MRIIHGDCIEEMKKLEADSIDAIVTDPPYEFGFMGKAWDSSGIAYNIAVWKEAIRVLKPGGYLLAFGGSRTYHRLACAIEDAGFEIRDQIMWVYGSGFPKSLNIDMAIDKMQGNERKIIGISPNWRDSKRDREKNGSMEVRGKNAGLEFEKPISEQAKQWDGWGTSLKPAHEPIVVARKPLSEKTVAENVLKYGTGGLNIDGCRIGFADENDFEKRKRVFCSAETMAMANLGDVGFKPYNSDEYLNHAGRFPANFIHDGSDEVLKLFPDSSETGKRTIASQSKNKKQGESHIGWHEYRSENEYNDSGSASRFFYCAKASKSERDEGCDGLEEKNKWLKGEGGTGISDRASIISRNNHPTVKPIALMRYLCRLVTPSKGVILDPFLGSGTTAIAAYQEGFDCIGIEKEDEYIKIAEARVAYCAAQKKIGTESDEK